MKIIVNGEEKAFEKDLTVERLVRKYKLKKESVAVELNKNIVKKVNYENTFIKNGDKVEIVHFVGGG